MLILAKSQKKFLRSKVFRQIVLLYIIMSTALAAARKRRAPASLASEPVATQNAAQPAQSANAGLTLPQVIALVDRRLIALEQYVKTQKEADAKHPEPVTTSTVESSPVIDSVVDEFNSRYTILAEEIENLKNIVLNLQSYTMEVNKTLLEERVRVLSDIEQPARTLKIDNARVSFSTEKQIEYLEDIGEFSMSESGI